MHDVTHYLWLQPGVKPDAATLPGATRGDGAPIFWTAPGDHAAAMAAPMGPKSSAIFAVANHGRWIAECPDCHGAQLTGAHDPRFMCCECGNASIGGQWRPVIWPKDHAEIGELLDQRPRHLANAGPGETSKHVRKENAVLADAALIGADS